MNSQEEKIYALAGENEEVIILEPRKDESFAKMVISSFMNLPFTSKDALAERVRVNSYFLIRNEEKSTLYSMDDDLNYDFYDVTEAINKTGDNNSFVFMGYKFRYHEILD